MGSPTTDINIAALDRVAALTWRGTEGFTGRANSVLTSGDPGMPLPEAAARIRAWYTARGLAPMVSVSYPLGRPDRGPVDEFFAARGWRLRDEAEVIVMTQRSAVLPSAPAALPVTLDRTPSDDWLALYHFRGQPTLPPIARTILTSAPWQAFASLRDGARTVAIGRVASADARGEPSADHWASLTAIEVDPDYRRRGLAAAVTSALIAHAAQRGTSRVFLQVEDGNQPALALYRRLGFTEHHGYHYRVAPAS
jgi:ribosomal protein S18 acetylase RimI-like enzyme